MKSKYELEKNGADKKSVPRQNGCDESFKDTDMQLLSVKHVCERLGIGEWMFYQLLNKNRINTVQIGSRRLIKPSALRAYINSLEIAEFDANDY